MTKQELAKLLGIDESQIELENGVFKIFNASIVKNISLQLWWEDISLEFWQCEFKERIIFLSEVRARITFQDCIFEKFVNARSSLFQKDFKCNSCIFEQSADFSKASFKGKVNFEITRFKNEARFIETRFLAKSTDDQTIQNTFREAQFEGNASFDNTIFNGKVNFEITRFKNEASFMEVQFKGDENIFREAQFEGNTDFSDAKFNGKVDFRRTKFLGKMLWHKITSDENVNFQSSVFGGVTSFEDSKIELIDFLNCTFSNQFNINHQYLKLDYQELKNKIEQTSKEKDKNAQEQENRTSHESRENDQSNTWRDLFRKLKSNRLVYHNLIDASELRTQELYAREIELDSKNLSKSSKDWIEKWQLWFYRHTSDHHTDLLKMWHTLLSLIGIFGMMSVGIIIWFYIYKGNNDFLNLLDIKAFYDCHIFYFIRQHSSRVLGINLCFIIAFLVLFVLSLCRFARYFFILLGYLVSILLLAISPKLLVPAIGFFTEKREMLDPLSIIGGIYTIIFGFLAYSFIKTARKNSIVPS